MIVQHRNCRGLIAVSAILLGSCGDLEQTFYPEPISDAKILNPVMIVAHRGGMAYAPENTVTAFKNGQRLETDVLELDVQVRGNEIFVLHDFTLERTTNCNMQSSNVDARARDSCDAGYWWFPGSNTYSAGGGFPYFRGKGVKIPLLADVITEISHSDVRLMIELKYASKGEGQPSAEEALDTLLTFVSQRSIEDRIWINSSNPYALARVEAAIPTITTVLSWGDQITKSCEESVLDAISLGIDAVSLQASQSG